MKTGNEKKTCGDGRNLARSEAVQPETCDVVLILDNEHRIVSWSGGAERLFKHTAAEVIGRTLVEIDPAGWQSNSGGTAAEALERHGFWRVEGLRRDPNGKTIQVETTLTALQDASGRREGMLAVIREAGARSRLQQELHESEEEVSATFELVGVGQAEACPDTGRFCRVNRSFCGLTGYSRDELLGMTFIELTHPEDRDRDIESYRCALRRASPSWTSEKRLIRKDGSVIWVTVTGTVIFDDAGTPLRSTSIVHDITASRRAQEALLHSEEQHRCLVESAPMTICVQQEGCCVYLNHAGLELFGAARFEDIAGKRFIDLVHPSFRQNLSERSATIERSGGARPARDIIEIKMLRLDGQELDVEIAGAGIMFNGRPAVQLFIRDVSGLRNTELRLRLQATVLAQVSDAVVAVGRDRRIIFWNKAAERLYKIPAEDAIGKLRKDIYQYRWVSEEEHAAREAMVQTGFQRGENVHILRNGEEVHVESSVSVLLDWGGAPAGWLAVMRDVTGRKKLEEELRMSERLYRMMFESNPHPMWIYDLKSFAFLFVNDSAVTRYGYSREEFLSMTIKDIRPPEDVQQQVDVTAEAEDGLRDFGVWRHRKKDGSIIDVEVMSQNLTLNGRDARVVLAHDITERKRAEDELRQARIELEQRVKDRTAELVASVTALQLEIAERKRTQSERDKLVAAVEAAAEAIVVTDKSGIIQYVNPAFESVTGYPQKEAMGQSLHFLDSGQHDEVFFERMRSTMIQNGFWKGRLINRKKDGSLYHEECTYSPVKDSSGNIVNYVSIKHDVTEKLRLEAIAESVDAMNNIGYVFSGIRHEMGNPISSLLIIMNLLKKKFDSGSRESVRSYLDQAISQAERIEYLLTSLKNFNMYENLRMRELNLSEFMKKFLSLVESDLEKNGVSFSAELGGQDWRISADPRALQQALLNLVVNASDALAGRANARITFSVTRSGNMISIRVADNGAGISDDRKKDLFRPFYTTKPNGTGLGLVITRKLIARMNGMIEITSAVNSGTTVDIYLPEETT